MRLRALRVHDLRRFAGRGVALDGIADGLNLFAEPNETGKSTLFDALQALVFLPHGSSRKEVRELRPYAGGAPRIEAEIETAEGRFRIEKRYLKGAFARVTDLARGRELRADEAEGWIAEVIGAGGQEAGPAGLLWVRQGASGELEGGGSARAEALEAVVAEELAVLTGGRRMARIEARLRDRLEQLVTPTGQARKGGPLAEAEAALAALEAELGAETARLEELQADLDALAGAERRLARAEDPEERARLEAALAEARERQQKAREQAAARDGAATDLRLAEMKRRAAAEA
ncbi:AAA family ATPase, partial [Paralimibaculum aggregatum]|uniref:AAA family ATPase n=1 Tax=Paralimibaculum aggregatum TaxID=3036245 RepID=UPI0025574BB8